MKHDAIIILLKLMICGCTLCCVSSLPEPLMTFRLHQKFISAASKCLLLTYVLIYSVVLSACCFVGIFLIYMLHLHLRCHSELNECRFL